MKPDIIVTWPRNCDYPLWRHLINTNRDKFSSIYIVFMETNYGHDYRTFIREVMQEDHVTFIDSPSPEAGQDWRDVAIKEALKHSSSEWVWFTEQDFFPKDNFWEYLIDPKYNYLAVMDGERMHPCSLLVKRLILTNTRMNFGIVPDKLDHFGLLQQDLSMLPFGASASPDSYIHLAGLSHNMTLLERGEAPNHNPSQFDNYIKICLKLPVKMDDHLVQLFSSYINSNRA